MRQFFAVFSKTFSLILLSTDHHLNLQGFILVDIKGFRLSRGILRFIVSKKQTLLQKCPNTVNFLAGFFCIQAEYGDLRRKSKKSKYGKTRTRKNSVFVNFSRSEINYRYCSYICTFIALYYFITEKAESVIS